MSFDFKSTILAEIAAKKKEIEKVIDKGGGGGGGDEGKKNWIKQGELEKIRKEEYLARERAREEERRTKVKIEEEKETSKEIAKTEESNELSVEVNEAIESQLKMRGEPIRIFGESDRERIKRLKRVENREEAKRTGQMNELLQMKSASVGEEENILVEGRLEDVKEIKDWRTMSGKEGGIEVLKQYFGILLREWKEEIERDEKMGDNKVNLKLERTKRTFEQTKVNLLPLFDQLRTDSPTTTLAESIQTLLLEIVYHLQKRSYMQANDAYLRLSIGNAPWPIGVTMIGIHERSAREKIQAGQVGHVLNDEVTRKWIQGIKRLMTTCQRLYPPQSPSMKMG